MVRTLAAVERVAESANRVSAAVERFPDDVAAILADAGPTLAAADEALAAGRAVAEPLQAAAEQIRMASASWAEILAVDGEPHPDARPFDVREWERALREVTVAATALQGSAGEIRGLLEAERLGGAVRALTAAVDDAETRARGVVDLAAQRLLQLLGAVFMLAVAYRLIASYLASRPSPRTPD